jgi:hypothetical protein
MKLYGAVILLSLALTSAAFLKGKNSGKHRRIEPSKSSSEDSGAKDESFLSSANLIPNTDPPFLQEPVGAGGEAEVEVRVTDNGQYEVCLESEVASFYSPSPSRRRHFDWTRDSWIWCFHGRELLCLQKETTLRIATRLDYGLFLDATHRTIFILSYNLICFHPCSTDIYGDSCQSSASSELAR